MPLQNTPTLEGHLAGDAAEKHMRAPVARDSKGEFVWARADLPRARDAERSDAGVPRPARAARARSVLCLAS